MATVTQEQVLIELSADVKGLVQSMKKAENTTNKAMNNIGDTVKRAGQLFLTYFAGSAIVGGIKKANNEMDKLAKTASKLGVGAERLQELQYAADLTGVSADTLNMALQRMVRRVSEAANGTGEAVGALQELNISALELNQLSPDQQFKRIADAMEDAGTQSDKVRLAMKLFDSEGVALVNTLKGGTDQLNAYADEANSLGIILNGQVLANAEAVNDQLYKVGRIVDTAQKAIATGLTPVLTVLATSFAGASAQGNYFANIAIWVAEAAASLTSSFHLVGTVIDAAASGLKLLGTAAVEAFTKMTNEDLPTNKLLELEAATARAAMEANKAGDEMIKAMAGADEFTKNLNASVVKLREQLLGLKLTTEDVSGAQDEGVGFWKAWSNAANEAMKNASNSAKQAKALVDGINSSISDGLTSAFRDSLDGIDSWAETFEKVLKDILAQIFKVIVAKKIAGMITGDIGVALASAKGNVITSGHHDKAYAKGGVVDQPTYFGMSGGKTGLMGEAGSEAILPLDRMSNGDLGVKGTALNVNVINNAGVDVQTSQEGDDFNITLSKIDAAMADGIRRRTSQTSQAIAGLK